MQNEWLSGVSRFVCQGSGNPIALLKNWRSPSTIETSAVGVLNMRVARRVKRSNGSSGGVSRRPVRWTAASRFRLRTMANRSDITADYNP